MNKQPPTKFNFLYPILDKRKHPAKHLTDLHITATVEIGRINQVLTVSILKISHFAKGERFGSDIKEFLQYTNFTIYQEIIEAAKSHAAEKFALIPA